MIGGILAGGRASRMGGGDKGQRHVGGVSILERVIAAMQVQCDHLVAGVGEGPARPGLPTASDSVGGGLGPVAGVLAILDWAAEHHPEAPFVVTVPTDAPFLPHDLVARLQDQRVADRADIVCARSGERLHPTVALWSVALRSDIRHALVADGVRRLRDLLERHPFATVTWPCTPIDPFFNVNTPDDLATAERLVALSEAGPGAVHLPPRD